MEKLPAPPLLMPSGSTSPTELSLVPDQASFAADRALVLFGCFRKGDANDPDTYTAAITAVLSEYPAEVIQHVTDPRTGIARKINWLPTIAEVDAACRAHAEFCNKRDHLLRSGWQFENGKWIKPQ